MQGLLDEIERNIKLEAIYRDLEGGVGILGATFIRADMDKAKKAIGEGDMMDGLDNRKSNLRKSTRQPDCLEAGS